jgi:hypothetical protein
MTTKVRIAVIVPAGPKDDALDTLASIVAYTAEPRVILVIDDARRFEGADGDRLRRLSADLVVLPAAPGAPGLHGGLMVKMAAAYRWLLERYEPQLVMRMDTDAVMLGPGIEDRAERAFAANPGAGLLGAYRIGPDGGCRDFSWAARQVRLAAGAPGLIHPRRRQVLRSWLRAARGNGYVDGEHVLGGAFVHSYAAVSALRQGGFLDTAGLFRRSPLGDDHLLSLMTIAAGYRLLDFGGPDSPMALTWLGLPAHPADLLARGKLVTHSARYWDTLGEPEIRAIFAAARAQDTDQAAGGRAERL